MAGSTTGIPEGAAVMAAEGVTVRQPTPATSPRTRVSLYSDELGHEPDEH
jgi:hypothetical protein